MDKLEYKAVATEFKAIGDQGQYEGHFSVFGNVDDGMDKAMPGMFAKTIVERGKRVKVFYAHDWMKLIGPPPTTLEEDSIGLLAAGRLTLDSFWGKEAFALMKDGALTEGSFGYEAVKFDFEDTPGVGMVRNLREVKLYEISPVPLGMNALTQIRAVKAALSRGGDLSQEPFDTYLSTLSLITKELKDGRVLSAANKDKIQSAVDALSSALDALNTLLAAADPDAGKTLQSTLLRRARAAEFALQFAMRSGG